MPEKITIATFNWQNKYRFIETIEDEIERYVFIKFLLENEIDILGSQEIPRKSIKKLKSTLNEKGYDIKGKGRLKTLGSFFPFYLVNETNAIFSKLKQSKKSETIELPWLGSQFPRIITKCTFDNIVFLNTHLDYLNNKVKKKQLDAIYNIVNYEIEKQNKVILTGDFNMTSKNKNFRKFINELENLNIIRINFNKQTHKTIKKGAIDHIFIPKEWGIEEVKYLDLQISDHYAIMAKIKTNNK